MFSSGTVLWVTVWLAEVKLSPQREPHVCGRLCLFRSRASCPCLVHVTLHICPKD